MKSNINPWLFALVFFILVLISGCTSPATPMVPTSSPTATLPVVTTAPSSTETGAGGGQTGLTGLMELVPTLADIAPTRTPMPTATPDALTQSVSKMVQNTGLSGKTLLWLDATDWINLGISLIFVLVAYLIGTWLIYWLFPRLVRRTKTNLDDQLLQASGNQVRWLAVILILQFATKRLDFINAEAKTTITDIYFWLIWILSLMIVFRLINLAIKQAEEQASKLGRLNESESLIALSAWGIRLAVLILAVTIVLSHFAINITGIAIFLGFIGLAISLAGRDVLADLISGVMILIDRPFRIGDRLELPSISSWGDVVDIGMRSTKILSVENRMVVIPNSQIGKNQIVNYSYPDPSYFDTVNVLVGYDNDVEQVEQLLAEAIHSVEGVQKEREIYTLLIEFTDTHMLFWACWWIASYKDRYPVHGKVSKAIMQKLKGAGVTMPFRSGNLNVKVNPDLDTTPKAEEPESPSSS